MKTKLLFWIILGTFSLSLFPIQATSIIDILNEESTKPIEEIKPTNNSNTPNEANTPKLEENNKKENNIQPTPKTKTPTKEETKEPKPKEDNKITEEIKDETPESFIMNFSTNKSCNFLNKELKTNIPSSTWIIANTFQTYNNNLFSEVQTQEWTIIFLKNYLITFKDRDWKLLSQLKISDKISSPKLFVQNKKLFLIWEFNSQTTLLTVNIDNILQPTIQHFDIFNWHLVNAQFNKDNLIIHTKKEISTTKDHETYEAMIENWKIKINKKNFDCTSIYYLTPDNSNIKNLWTQMSLHTIVQYNIKNYSKLIQEIIGNNINIFLQTNGFLAYAPIKEDKPILCNNNIQCTLENKNDYTLFQSFDFKQSWATHLIPWHTLALQEELNGKLDIISTSHLLYLDKNLKLLNKFKLPKEINKGFFANNKAFWSIDDMNYYVSNNNLLVSKIKLNDGIILLPQKDNNFIIVNDNWLTHYEFSDQWIFEKNKTDFNHTILNSKAIRFDKTKGLLFLPMSTWEEKPTEICNYEKIKIDWELQEKENCHTEKTIKQNFIGVKTFKIPSFKILNEQRSENKLENILIWPDGAVIE